MRVKSKVWLERKGELVFGDGKSQILKAIDRTGSISKASRKMGFSFRHGWGYITAIEKRMGFKLIERSKGGRGGGGSCLTPAGRQIVKKFDSLQRTVNKFTDKQYKEIFGGRSRCNKNK